MFVYSPTSGRKLLGVDDFGSIFLSRGDLYAPSDHRECTPEVNTDKQCLMCSKKAPSNNIRFDSYQLIPDHKCGSKKRPKCEENGLCETSERGTSDCDIKKVFPDMNLV